MIEVFKTNVNDPGQSQRLISLLGAHYPQRRINFDLEDCDKVLRIEGQEFCPTQVIELLRINGHQCEVLI